MKPIDDVWDTITSFQNLRRAAKRAALGKRSTAGVARFLFRLEPELLALQRELQDGSYRPGVPFTFEIVDPKLRTIAAAPFPRPTWAELMKRVFEIDVLHCPHCGGRRRLIALITDSLVARRILRHLDLPSEPPPPAPARPPPQMVLGFG